MNKYKEIHGKLNTEKIHRIVIEKLRSWRMRVARVRERETDKDASTSAPNPE